MRSSPRQAAMHFAILAVFGITTASPIYAGSVSAAKSRVTQAQDYADHNRNDDAKDKLDEAEKFLDGLTDSEKAPIQKDIDALRAKLGTPKPAGTNTPTNTPAPAGTVDSEAVERITRNLDRSIKFAQEETNPSVVQGQIESAQQVLDNDDAKKNLSADARKKYQAQIDDLRAKVKAAGNADAARRLAQHIDHMISGARGVTNLDSIRDYLQKAHAMLDSEDAKQKLDAPTLQRLAQELADTEAQIHQRQKHDALARAEPPLKELEEQMATDPFKGVQPAQAYKVTETLNALVSRVKYQLSTLPADDADRKIYEGRLTAAQQKIDAADAGWAAANIEAAIQNRWQYAMQGTEGWESEQYTPGSRAFEMPRLDKTEKAASNAKYFLEQKEIVEARQKGSALPKASETIAKAEKTLSDALTKLDAAFNQWMDAAEKQPRPQGPNRFQIGAAEEMGRWAEQQLAGSKYKDPDVARGKKLDQKWKDELAAIEKEHEASLKKMSADADAAWPNIALSIHADTGFHPTDASAMKGKTFLFKKVRNRAGWDFDARYDLVIWVDGQPVAGTYDPKIKRAFADAANAIGDSVPDHVDWDVVAVIQGTATVNRRFSEEVKDEHLNVLGKIEGTRPVDCVVVKVIAIHAGPVAIGPE